jgi:hypothetical protein
MLLARLVTVRPYALANERRPAVVVSTHGFDRLLKLLTALFARK